MALDLSTLLRPVTVRSSFLGTVEVEARTRDFYDWLRQGRDRTRWDDPQAFVRSLLAEQTRLRSTGASLDAARIEVLTLRQLNAFAKAFIKAAGNLIVPRMVEDRTNHRLRSRREGEEYSAARRSDENESARLFRLLSDRDEERKAHQKQQVADMRKLLEGPADLLRRFDPVGDQINKLRREILGPSLLAQAEANKAIAFRSRLEAQTRSDAEAISRAIEAVALGRTAHASLMQQYGMLTAQLADRESQISRARDTLGFVTGTTSSAGRFLQAEMAQGNAWGEAVKQFLNPGVSSGLLASMIGVRHNIAISQAIEAAAGLSRGFTTAANLGLAGVAARGAVADVLGQYRADPLRHSSVFREVISGIQLVDAEELDDEELAASVSRARDNASRIDLTNPAQAQVFLALVTLLLMVYFEVAHSSASSGDVQAVRIEISGMRDDFRRAREEDRREWRDIRYVAQPTFIRLKPDVRSKALLTVYPDQLLRVLQAKGNWAHVEVIQYSSGSAVSGWISRRHLRVRPS